MAEEINSLMELEEQDFTQAWDLSDVSFVVQGRRVYASRTILAMWSPVMKAMFYDEFKEKYATEINLPDKQFEDILELVKVLHPPNKDIDETNIGTLLPLAREYQIDQLLFRCERFLLDRPSSVNGLVLAEEYNMECLKRQCMKYVKVTKVKELAADDNFDFLADTTKVDMLMEKTTKYEDLIYEVKDIVNGLRPEQVRFRYGGTLCTVNCTDKGSGRPPHNAGKDMACKTCALYMLNKIQIQINKLP